MNSLSLEGFDIRKIEANAIIRWIKTRQIAKEKFSLNLLNCCLTHDLLKSILNALADLINSKPVPSAGEDLPYYDLCFDQFYGEELLDREETREILYQFLNKIKERTPWLKFVC